MGLDKLPEVFGVIWMDLLTGPLCLTQPTKEKAIALALDIIKRGEGHVDIGSVTAVHIPAGTSQLIDLLPELTSRGNKL